MKEYIKPTIVEEEIEIEDVMASSGVKGPTSAYNPKTDTPANSSDL